MTKLGVEVIRDHAAFLAMSHEWDALVERARIEHPFLSHDWVRSWWECFGAGNELYVLVVRAGAEMIAIAPLMRSRTRVYGLSVVRLEFMANVHTPRFDFIVAERAEEAYAVILDHLETQAAGWDIVMLRELAENSRTDPALGRLAALRSLRSAVWIAGASPRIPLNRSFEDYCSRLSAKHRSDLRRRLRNLSRLGEVALDVVSGEEQIASALEDGLRIEASSWKGSAGTAIALHDDIRRLYALIAERAARSGILSLLFLKVGEKRVAFAYCLRHGGTLYLLKTGYDPEYARHSPFNTLMFLAIEAACRDGLDAIDLLGCEEPWKRFWTDTRIERRWFFLHSNSVRALLIYGLKFVILPRIRRLWGHRALAAKEQRSPRIPAKVA